MRADKHLARCAVLLGLALVVTAGCRSPMNEVAVGPVAKARQRVRQQPNTHDSWLALGQAYLNEENYNDAHIAFKRAWSMDQKSAPALRGLAECALALGDPQTGLNWVKQALALDSQDATAIGLRGRLKFSQGDLAGAYQDLMYARKLASLALKDSLTLTNVHLAQKKPEEALAQAEETVRRFPLEAHAHHNYGVLLDTLDRPREAEDEYRLAIKCDPDLHRDKLLLAQLLVRRRQKLDEARALALEVATKEPMEGVPAAVAARALYLQGDKHAGYKELIGVQKQFRYTPIVLLWIYEAAQELGDREVAESVRKILTQMSAPRPAASDES